jgi:subtilisin family serine protease
MVKKKKNLIYLFWCIIKSMTPFKQLLIICLSILNVTHGEWSSNNEQYLQQLTSLNNGKLVLPNVGNHSHSPETRTGEFLIVGQQDSSPSQLLSLVGGNSVKILSSGIYSASLSESELSQVLEQNWVSSVEPNIKIQIVQPKVEEDVDDSGRCRTRGGKVPWGLDRIDGTLDCQYHSNGFDGSGSHVYVLDTGLNSQHYEFVGRIGEGINYASGGVGGEYAWEDCHGHGTHVAGTALGTKYGVAKSAQVHPVRVLSCGGWGYTSWIISGLQWSLQHYKAHGIKNGVVSMSLGSWGDSPAHRMALRQVVQQGLTVVVAAGNSDYDGCFSSPGNEPAVISVGATDRRDERAWFSNYGICVDIFAPGVNIKSADIGSNDATDRKSGTSMSTPHVSGVVALLMQYLTERGEEFTPEDIRQHLWQISEDGVVKDSKSFHNYLLNVPDYTFAPTQAPTHSPTQTPTHSPTQAPTHREKTPSEVVRNLVIVVLVLVLLNLLVQGVQSWYRHQQSSSAVKLEKLESTLDNNTPHN